MGKTTVLDELIMMQKDINDMTQEELDIILEGDEDNELNLILDAMRHELLDEFED